MNDTIISAITLSAAIGIGSFSISDALRGREPIEAYPNRPDKKSIQAQFGEVALSIEDIAYSANYKELLILYKFKDKVYPIQYEINRFAEHNSGLYIASSETQHSGLPTVLYGKVE